MYWLWVVLVQISPTLGSATEWDSEAEFEISDLGFRVSPFFCGESLGH
jgi:hypothetical protein